MCPPSKNPRAKRIKEVQRRKKHTEHLKAMLAELSRRLASSEDESRQLGARLMEAERELQRQQQLLEERRRQEAEMAAQLRQNSPPRATATADIYNTASPFKSRTNRPVEAFTHKIDFSHIELKKTNLPIIEAERKGYEQAQQQWESRLRTTSPPPSTSGAGFAAPRSQPIHIPTPHATLRK
jgi:chromosome segregation ATPase